jgi:hypothetical protein
VKHEAAFAHAKLGQPQGGIAAPVADKEPLVEVVFVQPLDIYTAGERAWFPSSVAEELVSEKVARLV